VGICEDCGNELQLKDYNMLCINCGLIFEDYSISSEYTNNAKLIGKDRKKDDEQVSFQWYSLDPLGTKIGNFGDYSSKPSKHMKYLMRIGRRLLITSKNFRQLDKNLEVCKLLQLPHKIRRAADYLYEKNHSDEVLNTTSLLAACLYASIKKEYLPISITAVVTAFNDRGSDLSQMTVFRDLHKYNLMPRLDTFDRLKRYIYTFADRLLNSKDNLSLDFKKELYNELRKGYKLYRKKFKISGHSPVTSAWFLVNYSITNIAKRNNITPMMSVMELAGLFDIDRKHNAPDYKRFERKLNE